MKKRIRKKYAAIDASGVKEIADMQCYIDNLENFLWRMSLCIQGQDDCKSLIRFACDTPVEIAMDRIYGFIIKHREMKDESKGV